MKKIIYKNPNDACNFDLKRFVKSLERYAKVDEKEVKAAQSRLIKRFVYAALVFFVPMLVGVMMNILSSSGEGDTTSWSSCWKAASG